MRWGMVIDLRKCVGCQTCTIACHEENSLPPGIFWRHVVDVEIGDYPDVQRTFLPMGCQHCAEAPCVPVCPTGASQQRPDGIVFVQYDMCIGCGCCAMACPYRARHIIHDQQWYFGVPTPSEKQSCDPDRHGVMSKCTFCKHRMERAPAGAKPGLEPEHTPVCVNSCIANAMHFGDLDDPESNVSRLRVEHQPGVLLEELELQPSLFYISWPGTSPRDAPHEVAGPHTVIGNPDRETRAVAPNPAVTVELLPALLQGEWDLYHATWFTLMGIGGGVFLLSRLLRLERGLGVWLGVPLVDLVSFAIIALGGLVLLWSLGRPFRFLRAVLKPGTSWISRGAIADFVFLAAGAILVLPGLKLGAATPFAALPWDPWATHGTGSVIEVVALVCAAVVIAYAGLVLADRAAIPFWRSPAIPIQFVLSSLAMSMATAMVLETLTGEAIGSPELWLLLTFLALLLSAIVWHLLTNTTMPGKVESLDRLLGQHCWQFLAGVIAAGTILPAALAVLALAVPATRPAAAVLSLLGTVGGGFGLRLLTLRVGFFPPVRGRLPRPRR